MRGVGSGKPVGADAVVEAQGIQPNLECTHVEGSMRTSVILGAAGLWEKGEKDTMSIMRIMQFFLFLKYL